MNHALLPLILKFIVGCYGYMLVMGSANVISCEIRRPGQCGNQWTQVFTVSGGVASTLWAFITEAPGAAKRPRDPLSGDK